MVLFDLVGLIVVVGIIWAVVQTIKTWRTSRPTTHDLYVREQLVKFHQKYAIASTTLRSIANGAANPLLEATIALDEIEALEIKELSS